MKKEQLIIEMLGEDIAITPSDIYSQEFSRAVVGGYRQEEVDAFLQQVADKVDVLLDQMRLLKEKSEERGKALEENREMEHTLRSALVSSQKFGEDMVEAAKREADALTEQARLEAARIHLEASELPKEIAQDIRALERQRSQLRSEMKAILETHRRLLDSLIPEESVETPAGFFEAPSLDEEAEAAPTEEPEENPDSDGAESTQDESSEVDIPESAETDLDDAEDVADEEEEKDGKEEED